MTSTYYAAARHNSRPKEIIYHYFNLRGRGETPRIICAYGEIEFKDNRIESSNWPQVKESYPNHRVPAIQIDGQWGDQSAPICRYLAAMAGLVGSTPVEKFQIDSLAETFTEIREKLVPVMGIQDEEEKKTKMEEFMTFCGTMLGRIEKDLEQKPGANNFLIGNKISWADCHLFCVSELLAPVPGVFDSLPLISAVIQRVKEEPKIAKYLKDRPETPY